MEALIHMGQSFIPALSIKLEQKRWIVRLVQAGLEIGRLRLEGQGVRKLTAGEWFSMRGKPCRLEGRKSWKETNGLRG